MLFQFLKDNSFDSEIYTKELMRAVRGLLRKRQELVLNRTHYLPAHLKEAESRIQKCFDAITKCNSTVKILKRQCGFRYALDVFALTHGYFVFDATCRIMGSMRRLKSLSPFRFRRP
jgi:hypothetical protein